MRYLTEALLLLSYAGESLHFSEARLGFSFSRKNSCPSDSNLSLTSTGFSFGRLPFARAYGSVYGCTSVIWEPLWGYSRLYRVAALPERPPVKEAIAIGSSLSLSMALGRLSIARMAQTELSPSFKHRLSKAWQPEGPQQKVQKASTHR